MIKEEIAKMKLLGEDRVMFLEEAVSLINNKLPAGLTTSQRKIVKEIILMRHVEKCPS